MKESKKRCLVFVGGEPINAQGFKKEDFSSSDFIIAADSGCSQLERLSLCGIALTPDIILGDMDSFSRETALRLYPKAHFKAFPAEKDYTDTQLAVEIAMNEGFGVITVIGGTGRRADHFLANLALVRAASKRGIKLTICDGKNRIFYCSGEKIVLEGSKEYKYFSVIPDGDGLSGVTLRGAKYPLSGAAVSRDFPITISNETAAEKCEIEIESGSAFIVQCSD